MRKKIQKINAGFTIIEVLIAFVILATSTVAVQYFLTTTIFSTTSIKNNYIASLLVQEGFEVVRNIRDSEWFQSGTFGDNLPDGAGIYSVQWDSQALENSPDAFLKRDDITGLFNYNTGTDTIFKRTVDIETEVTGVEKRIIVTVSWTEKNTLKSFSAEEHLFDWNQ